MQQPAAPSPTNKVACRGARTQIRATAFRSDRDVPDRAVSMEQISPSSYWFNPAYVYHNINDCWQMHDDFLSLNPNPHYRRATPLRPPAPLQQLENQGRAACVRLSMLRWH